MRDEDPITLRQYGIDGYAKYDMFFKMFETMDKLRLTPLGVCNMDVHSFHRFCWDKGRQLVPDPFDVYLHYCFKVY